MATIDQLIAVRSFPAVVQAAEVRELRARPGGDAAVDDFVGGYLGFDERSRQALTASLRALAQDGTGAAVFFNGVFGSGKSHLLGLLALLADGRGHDAFVQTHPQLASCLEGFRTRFVLHFSLDDYDAARFSLEEIFWRELRGEWSRQGLPEAALPATGAGSRSEHFAELDEALRAQGRHGLVACIDELSLFLGAREHRALQSDAAFLQFLGQRCRRAPLWVFAALQKTVEDIGGLEAYSLSQIRDRFTTLPLSLAHLPSLIERRLIIRLDEAAVGEASRAGYESLARALPRLEFGLNEWQPLYPFHPATISLLEQVVARFLSRTRSAVLFCAHAAQGLIDRRAPANECVLPDALFDYLAPELDTHPDLRAMGTVWNHWRETVGEVADQAGEPEALLRLMKGLLLFKVAGIAPTAVQLANALALDSKLPGDGNYQYAALLLEKLRTRGSHLLVERHAGEYADRYTIDLGTRVAEMARRHTRSVVRELSANDARLSHYAVACCRDEPLPLAALDTVHAFSLHWRNAPRQVAVELWTQALNAQAVANRVALLAQPGHGEDALLLVASPFGVAGNAALLREAAALVPDPRRRAALWLWTPRPPLGDELDLAREAVAQHLLESDPQLLDNRRGRAILQYLKEGAAQREATLGRIAARLLREGQVATADGLSIEASELASADSWLSTLEAVAEFAFPHLFPRFGPAAPRLRVLTSSNCDLLCLDLLRRPAAEPYFGASLERAARAIAEPLGVATQAQGRWKIGPLRDDLSREMTGLIGDSGTPLSALDAALAKSEWGLRPEQTQVALSALLRSGEAVAFDSRGQALQPAQIGMPLRKAVHAVRRGRLLDAAMWQRLQAVMALLDSPAAGTLLSGPLSFAAQEQARAALAQWQENATAEMELMQARLHQLRRQLHHTPAQWPRAEAALEKVAAFIAALRGDAAPSPSGGTSEVLRLAAAQDAAVLAPGLDAWRRLQENLEARHGALLAAHLLLTQAEMAVPAELQAPRAALLERFDAGEALLDDGELIEQCAAWRAAYNAHYQEWHNAQHAPARWSGLRRLAASDELRALERLQLLRARPFEQARQVRDGLAEEMGKGCTRDGSLRPDEAVCALCRLPYGQRLRLRDPRELEAMVEQGIAAFRAALRDETVRQHLAANEQAAPLLEWSEATEVTADGLLPLLSDEVLGLLEDAFRPRRQVRRSARQLLQRFAACRSRADYLAAFTAWLDGGEAVGGEDEVVLEAE